MTGSHIWEQNMGQNKGTFHDLIVWQKAVDLSTQLYRVTNRMPDTERFGLTNQMRRAAVSIASNIAEGNARQHLKDYIHFLSMSRGSLAELETQLIIATRLNMLPDTTDTMERLREVRRILQGLIDSLRKRERGLRKP